MKTPARIAPWTAGLLVSLTLCAFSPAATARAATRPEEKVAPAAAERVDQALSGGMTAEPIPLIVQTWGYPGERDLEAVERLGGRAGQPFISIQAFPAQVPAHSVSKLALDPRVKRISLDWQVTPHMEAASVAAGVRTAHGGPARAGGRGVSVALLDSGVSAQPGVPEELASGYEMDVVEPDGRFRDPFGHGTHLAGIISGGILGPGTAEELPVFDGVAPGSRIVSVKVIDSEGHGYVRDVLAGVDWVLRNHESQGIRVVVLPLGHPVDESYEDDPLCQAVEMLWKAGIVVVVSAGNLGGHGFATITSPGNDPYVITVGAAEDWNTPESTDDLVASFSSRGPTGVDGVIKPDLIAPGTGITSLRAPGSYLDALLPEHRLAIAGYEDELPEAGAEPSYLCLSGTSMSAAIVGGATALLVEQDPEATPDDIKARLMIGARKMQDSIVARGAGLLDLEASLRLGDMGVASASSRSPQLLVLHDEARGETVQLQDIGTAWGDPFTWFTPTIWGESVTWGVSDLWASTEVWEDGFDTDAPPGGGAVIWALQ